MKKLALKKVFVNPKDGFAIVDASNPNLFRDDEGNGYLNTNDGTIDFKRLVTTLMVDSTEATNPIWFKKLKEIGIEIPSDATELEVDFVDEEEYSYKHNDGSFTKVPANLVRRSDKGSVALVDGVIKNLHKRTIKKYIIAGVNVGNEYFYNKLLGLKQEAKK